MGEGPSADEAGKEQRTDPGEEAAEVDPAPEAEADSCERIHGCAGWLSGRSCAERTEQEERGTAKPPSKPKKPQREIHEREGHSTSGRGTRHIRISTAFARDEITRSAARTRQFRSCDCMAKLLRRRYAFLPPEGQVDHLVVGAGVVVSPARPFESHAPLK